jgi:hypothetical protein
VNAVAAFLGTHGEAGKTRRAIIAHLDIPALIG